MDQLFLIAIGVSFAGFIFGLAAKSATLKKKNLKKNEFYNRLTILCLILMFILVIFYQFVI